MHKQLTILIVDAEQAFRDSMANLLLACGVDKFEMVGSVKDARAKIKGATFDMVFIDPFLPEMAGVDFAEQIQKRMPDTKVILLVEDEQMSLFNSAKKTRANVPSVLKSLANRDIPQLISEYGNSMSEKK